MIELEKGKALVLVGPVGSGKTMLARSIASRYGAYNFVTQGEILRSFNGPLDTTTVIVEEFTPDWETLVSIGRLATNPLIQIEKMREEPQLKTTPNVILCVQSSCPLLPKMFNPRWFQVFVVPPPAVSSEDIFSANERASSYVTYEDEAPLGDNAYPVRLDYEVPLPTDSRPHFDNPAFKPVCDCCRSHAATHGAYCHACSVTIEQEQGS